ncbi:MAG: hypothetical protein Q9208_005028 [Pyrenodesmia sp. 3 TL-2023]
MENPSVRLSQQWRADLKYQSSNGSDRSGDTVQRTPRIRNLTPSSIRSLGSVSSSPLRVRNENTPPPRRISRTAFHSADDASLFQTPVPSSKYSPHKSSWSKGVPFPPPSRAAPTIIQDAGTLEDDDDLVSPPGTPGQGEDSDKENQEPVAKEPRLSFEGAEGEVIFLSEPVIRSPEVPPKGLASPGNPRTSHSFKRWISQLRPHPLRHKKTLITSTKRWPIDDSPERQKSKSTAKPQDKRSGHRKSSSRSSAGLVDAVRSVAMTRSTSTPGSRKSRRSYPFSRSNRSSKISEDQTGTSLNDSQGSANAVDSAVLARRLQCQQTLKEIVDSEASYVADLKVLIYAYFTLLALAPNGSQPNSSQIHKNVTEILQLHEDLLHQVQDAVNGSRPLVASGRRELPTHLRQGRRHSNNGNRIASAVAGLVHVARTSIDSATPTQEENQTTSADTSKVVAVTKIFERMLGRFFIYEEYGAQYELMLRDMALTYKSISNWHAFERSIEALANSLATSSGNEESARKGLAFEDLLIKPIQRICKYPLLFEELYSNTLETDNAESRAELSKLLGRLREVTKEVDKATSDPDTQAKIQRSWRLQDLLVLPDVSTSPSSLRLLGYPILCGVLYVVWESEHEACGEWMLCVLFGSHLLLAAQQSNAERYDVVALVSLTDTQVEQTDDGRGLQCHTASFSWKLIFESSQHLYELIFCACSSKEEQTWTRAIIQCAERTSRMQKDDALPLAPIYTSLIIDAKPLCPVFGMFGSVIIRNTTAAKETNDDSGSMLGSIGRSKSVLTANRVPVLAPKRSERSRMESSLADVWSRERLPFPGMSTHRGDHALRASATSMIRRFSRASIGSTFTKRSVSTVSIAESKPGASVPDLQKIGEGDDDHDSRLGACTSFASSPGMSHADEQRLEGSGKLIRTGTVKGVRLSDATNQVKNRNVARASAQIVRVESTEKGSPRIVRNRRSIPGGLLKGFSGDAMKAWRGEREEAR